MKRTEIGAINIFDVLCAAESPGALWLSLKDSAEQGKSGVDRLEKMIRRLGKR